MTPFIVGAYAALPADRPAQEELYGLLREAEWVDGLEIPYRNGLDADPAWFADQLAATWRSNVVTAVPGTTSRLSGDPVFGLASADEEGRQRALAYTEEVRRAMAALQDRLGARLFAAVELHSAPSRAYASPDAFARSITEIAGWDWGGAQPMVEHCDALVPDHPADKGFLRLEEELAATSLPVVVNWGRSVIEARSVDGARRDVETCVSAGRFGGLVLSGAGDRPTAYGAAWKDCHLPPRTVEPTSLMGDEEILDAVRAAVDPVFLGVKIKAPAGITPADLVAVYRHVHDLVVRTDVPA